MNCEEYKKHCINLIRENRQKTLISAKERMKEQFPNLEVIITGDDNFYAKICEFEFIVDTSFSTLIFLRLPRNHDYIDTGSIYDEFTLGQFFAANERPSGGVIHRPKSSWWNFRRNNL